MRWSFEGREKLEVDRDRINRGERQWIKTHKDGRIEREKWEQDIDIEKERERDEGKESELKSR